MPYATPSDVASLNKSLIFGVGRNPTASDIAGYINMVAGEIDSILVSKGYDVPVNVASWPEAGALLNSVNARGGLAMFEEAAPVAPNVDRSKKAYDAALKMLADAQFVFDADLEEARSEPRGPYVTYQPSGRTFDPLDHCREQDRSLPFFSRSMRF